LSWTAYIILGATFASLFFIGAIWALNWAHKHGQFKDLDAGANTIFDEDEPVGQQTDAFPAKRRRANRQ